MSKRSKRSPEETIRAEIEKQKTIIAKAQSKISELNKKKSEIENAKYLSVLKHVDLTPEQLEQLISNYSAASSIQTQDSSSLEEISAVATANEVTNSNENKENTHE